MVLVHSDATDTTRVALLSSIPLLARVFDALHDCAFWKFGGAAELAGYAAPAMDATEASRVVTPPVLQH